MTRPTRARHLPMGATKTTAAAALLRAVLLAVVACCAAGVPLVQRWDGASFVLSNVFGDNMVLQHGVPAVVWGWAPGGTVVNTTFRGTVLRATADSVSGLWRQSLPPQPASLTSTGLSFTASVGVAVRTLTLNNVLFGNVLFCSGQSNMEFTVSSVTNATAEVAAANGYPHIRVVSGPEQNVDTLNLPGVFNTTHEQLFYQRLNWSVATSQSIGCVDGSCQGWDYFSAVCWFAARDLFDSMGGTTPVGAISQNYGGTSIQFWMSDDAIKQSDAPQASQCCGQNGGPSCLWNTQVHPYTVGPMQMSAILWYQGEQNADCGGPYQPEYNRKLQAMVRDWREKFQQPNLAFGNCLLAAWKSNPAHLHSFPLLRLAQANVTRLPKTFLVSAIDRGDPTSGAVHSPYKQDVGRRAAWGISDVALGQSAMYKGPTYLSAEVDATATNDVTIEFEQDGLYGRPPAVNASVTCPPTIPANNCESFAILAAPSCTWVAATALSSAASQSGVTLRPANWSAGQRAVATRGYFANWPVVTVSNHLGTPATPWLEYIDPATTPQACPLVPPPPPPPAPPAPCITVAPKGYKQLQQQGFWSNFTMVGMKTWSVAECAAACDKYGARCCGFHLWEPCPDGGDCYVFLDGLRDWAAHPGAFAYQRA